MNLEQRTRVICIYNQKGGVGKSTCAVNTAQIMAEVMGKKVLLIDYDAQGTATLMCNIPTWDESIPNIGSLLCPLTSDGEIPTVDDILNCVTRGKYIKTERKKGQFGWIKEEVEYPFDIIPVCGTDLSIAELSIHNRQNWIWKNSQYSFFILKMIVDIIVKECDYDYIIIDANPSLSSFAINALMASDYLIIPTTMAPEAINGIQAIFKRLDELGQYIPYYKPLGIVYQKYDGNRTLDKEIISSSNFEEFETKIPDVNTRVSKSINENLIPSIRNDKRYIEFRQAYISLCKEIEEKIYKHEQTNGPIMRRG